jgi:hypothetical protein
MDVLIRHIIQFFSLHVLIPIRNEHMQVRKRIALYNCWLTELVELIQTNCVGFIEGLRRKIVIRQTVLLQTAVRRYVRRHVYMRIRKGVLFIQLLFFARRKRRRGIMRGIVFYWQLLVKQTKRSKVQLLVRLMIKKLGIIHRYFFFNKEKHT